MDAREVAPGEQAVPVDPLEQKLPGMVDARLTQQRQRAEPAGNRLDLVVEVDQQCLAAARLDEAVRVPVVTGLELVAGDEVRDVLRQDLRLEVRHAAGL